jgi:hypothetical protein
MAKLTAQQANDLANNFLGLAQAIGDYRFDNWNTLSKTENQSLGNFQWSILSYGEDILALSTALVMDDVQDSLAQINNVTLEIKETIKSLNHLQKAINVAACIVSLGGAIVSKNPQAIVAGIQGVRTAWAS